MATFLNIYSAPKREQQSQPKGRLKRPKRAGSLPQEPTPFRAAYPFKSTRPPSSTTGVVEARNSTEFSSSSPHKNEHGRILLTKWEPRTSITKVPFPYHIAVMGDVAGDYVAQGIHREGIITCDSRAHPRLCGQVLEQ